MPHFQEFEELVLMSPVLGNVEESMRLTTSRTGLGRRAILPVRALRRDGASSRETDGDGARGFGEGRPTSGGTRAVSAGFGARKRASSVAGAGETSAVRC